MIISFNYDGLQYVNIDTDSEFFEELNISDTKRTLIINGAIWYEVRNKRDDLINSVQWFYQRHERELRLNKTTSLTPEQLNDLDNYIQRLADIPQTYSNPEDVVWPPKPALPQPAAY